MWDHRNPLPRHGEIVGHEVGKKTVERDEAIHVAGPLAKEVANLRIGRFGNLLDEDVFARQAADNARAGRSADAAGHAEEQRIGEMDDVGLQLAGQQPRELLNLLPLMAVLTLER